MKKILKGKKLFGDNGILNGKRALALSLVLIIAAGSTAAYAAGESSIKSQGIIYFNNNTTETGDDVVFDASDLTRLETEIGNATAAAEQGKSDLVDKLKDKLPADVTDSLGTDPSYTDIADAIGNIGKGADVTPADVLAGKKAYDGTKLITGTLPNVGAFTSSDLQAGESVTIPKGYHNGTGSVTAASLASQTGVTGTYTNTHDTEDTSDDTVDNLVAATADNLSLGTAAWVNGQYIVGNGADNNSYYALGKDNGSADFNGKAVFHIIYLGTGASFDVSSYDGYQKFTIDNFIVGAKTASSHFSGTTNGSDINHSGNTTLSVSYNSSTGILSVGNTCHNYSIGNWSTSGTHRILGDESLANIFAYLLY